MTERHALGIGIRHHSGGLRSHIAELYECALCEEHGSIESNARLIAAAPLMLNALRAALEAIGDSDDDGESVRDIIADAIAKATGEEVQG